MADKLHYNVDTLRDRAAEIAKIGTDLEENKKNLLNMLGKLKGDWDSDAGNKFFQIYDTSWVPHVDKYCEMLAELSRELGHAADMYEPLTREYNKLEINF